MLLMCVLFVCRCVLFVMMSVMIVFGVVVKVCVDGVCVMFDFDVLMCVVLDLWCEVCEV